jgi:IclR family pca regulon transcriptional regulator
LSLPARPAYTDHVQTKVRNPNSMDDAMTSPAPDNPKNIVQSLAKGFRVLEAFSSTMPELTLAEVARRADLDNATAFRLLNTLVMLGYVARVPGTRDFRLTLKCLDLGFNSIARMDLRERVRPVLRSLVGEVNEAASVGVLDGADVVYIERVQAGLVRLGVDVRVGSRIPAYCSALGLAILAYLPGGEQARVLHLKPRVKLTPRTVNDLKDIQARLARVRRAGYVVVDQEITSGLRALAAPVLDPDGQVIAAVSVVAPSMRMPLERFLKVAVGPVQEAARTISKAMQAGGAIARQAA